MRVIPAIDVIDGKCVRLSQGDYNQKKVYNESPLEVAKRFEDNGIKYLHLVDLDGAKARKIVNQKILELICGKTNLKVDFGGGLKSTEDVNIAFDSGAHKVTAGSTAITNPLLVKEWIQDFGQRRIILGADIKANEIMINGWMEGSGKQIMPFIREYMTLGINELISTDVTLDGMLQGPSFNLYKEILLEFPKVKLIASGGISTIEDLNKLSKLGLDGAILGKAIYENRISLKELQTYAN